MIDLSLNEFELHPATYPDVYLWTWRKYCARMEAGCTSNVWDSVDHTIQGYMKKRCHLILISFTHIRDVNYNDSNIIQ